jgi:peptidoglycan/LPS O-acetylase OafA/YrhL
MNGKIRVHILDSFRAIAILSIMIYHYFTRWAPPVAKVSLYPYDDKFSFLKYGIVWVDFFFMISGFVIFFTFENTGNFSVFWKKRVIRLFPSVLFASLLIIVVFNIFDTADLFHNSHKIKNLLPSFSFINPTLFNNIFDTHFEYINGSYWSLWPEIQFYLLSSLIYYFNKKNFVRNFTLVSFVLIGANYFFMHVQGNNKLNIELPAPIMEFYAKWIYDGFNLCTYLPFFCLGVLFYQLSKNYKEGNTTSSSFKICISVLLLFILYSGVIMPIRLFYLGLFALFLIFIYYPEKLGFLEQPAILKVGVASYFLYLIHENLGVLIINKVGPHFLPSTPFFPIVVIIALSCFSVLFTEKIDLSINKWLKSKFLK